MAPSTGAPLPVAYGVVAAVAFVSPSMPSIATSHHADCQCAASGDSGVSCHSLVQGANVTGTDFDVGVLLPVRSYASGQAQPGQSNPLGWLTESSVRLPLIHADGRDVSRPLRVHPSFRPVPGMK